MFGLTPPELFGLVLWVLTPIACGLLGWRKGYPAGLWMLLGLFVPVLALVILACLPFREKAAATPARTPLDDRLLASMRDVVKGTARGSPVQRSAD